MGTADCCTSGPAEKPHHYRLLVWRCKRRISSTLSRKISELVVVIKTRVLPGKPLCLSHQRPTCRVTGNQVEARTCNGPPESVWAVAIFCDSTAPQDAREAEWAANCAALLGCAALNGKNPAALKMSKSSYGRHGRWCCCRIARNALRNPTISWLLETEKYQVECPDVGCRGHMCALLVCSNC
jgi:hypothetical protein